LFSVSALAYHHSHQKIKSVMNAATTGGAPAAEITKIVEQVQSVLKKFDLATKEPKANLEVVNAMIVASSYMQIWMGIKSITSQARWITHARTVTILMK